MTSPVQILRQSAVSTPEKTVIVFGVARGGTSLVSGTLLELGVFMGHNTHRTKHEYSPFYLNMPKRDLLTVIRANDHAHPVWGWKCPKDIFYTDQYLHHLRNPHVVIAIRNPLDTSLSSHKYNSLGLLHSLRQNHLVMDRIIAHTIDSELPTALVSYEKSLASPSTFVNGLASFLQLTVSEEQLSKAELFSSRGSYSLVSTSTSDQEAARRLTLDEDYHDGLTIQRESLAEDSSLLTKKIEAVSEDLKKAQLILAHLERAIMGKGLVASLDELKDRRTLEALILRERNLPETSITPPNHATECGIEFATAALVKKETQENDDLRSAYIQLKKDRAESQRFMELLFLLNDEQSG